MVSPKLILLAAVAFASAIALFACFVWLLGWPLRLLRARKAPARLGASAR